MYEKVFQLTTRPFVSTPDVERFFSAKTVHHALSQACSSIERASGTVLVIGPTGSGKTLFLNMLQEQFRSVCQVVNLACARLAQRQDLLQNILFELDQPYLDRSEGELRLQLIDYLKPGETCPNGILLLVDEAHLLSSQLLDEIRLLTNFVRDGRPRAQLVLAGNHRLEENLVDTSLESFNQRIATRCYLSNFSRTETIEFINAAIMRAGGSPNAIFTTEAMEAVHEVTDGCPRLINQVCDHSMILCAGAKQSVIDAESVYESWADVQNLPSNWNASSTVSHQDAQSASESSEIEFGQLDDGDETSCSTVECGTLSETPNEPACEQANDDLGEEGQWQEIQFGQLDENEAEEVKALSDASGSQAVEYEFEKVDELESLIKNVGVDPEKTEDYQLAPPEPVEQTFISPHEFGPVAEPPNTQGLADDALDLEDNYVDVRFKDLAQFLANGGRPDLEPVAEAQILDEVSDPVSSSVESVANAVPTQPIDSDDGDEPMTLNDQVEIQSELDREQVESVAEQGIEPSIECGHEEDEEFQSAMTAAIHESVDIVHSDHPVETNVLENSTSGDVEGQRKYASTAEVWADPFAESFETEEVVYDPYTARVAQQNLDSLEITRLQLSILDEEPAEQGHVESRAPSEESKEDSDNSVQLQARQDSDASESNELDTTPYDELVVSDSGVESVDESELLSTIQRQQDEIAEQILQLKQEFGEVDDTAANHAVEVVGDTKDGNDDELPMTLKTEQKLSEGTSDSDDDRDILVITRVDRRPQESVVDEVVEEETPVSTGRAVRMEYNQLFKQLRAAE